MGWQGRWRLVLGALTVATLGATPAHAATGDISTLVGPYSCSPSNPYGDGGPANRACLSRPSRARALPGGGYLIADSFDNRVRVVGADGIIHTLAGGGSGPGNFGGDGGPATSAQLSTPWDAQPMSDGSVLIADLGNARIRQVAPDGTISTVAGGGLGGDGCPATRAEFGDPAAVAPTPGGGFLLADSSANSQIRRVDAGGVITSVAGFTIGGGDGSKAPYAALGQPQDVAPLPDGGFLIADGSAGRIRRVSPDGTISTVAGDGGVGFSGDGGPATQAELQNPDGVAPTSDGGFVIADTYNHRIRYVSPQGIISTIAGSGGIGAGLGAWSGDGGPATQARLNDPGGVALLPSGGILIADTDNSAIRLVQSPLKPATPGTFSGGIGTRLADYCDGLDPSFAGGSLDLAPPGHLSDPVDARAIALQADGKVLVAGRNGILRVDAAGQLDSNFGANGVVTTPGGNTPTTISAIALQSDGAIVAAGTAGGKVAVVRYTDRGQLDASFGSGGEILVAMPGSTTGRARAVAIQGDGRVVVGATTNEGPWYAVRLTVAGALDGSFGSGGVANPDPTQGGELGSVALQADGKILLTGAASGFKVVRLTANGTLDSAFGSGGTATGGPSNVVFAPGSALTPGGKLVLAGGDDTNAKLVRFLPDGSVDTSFASAGIATLPGRSDSPGKPQDVAYGVVADAAGRLVVAATNTAPWAPNTFMVERLTPAGQPDTSFGHDGRYFTRIGAEAYAEGLAIADDGKIVVGGSSFHNGSWGFALARYQADVASPTTAPPGTTPPATDILPSIATLSGGGASGTPAGNTLSFPAIPPIHTTGRPISRKGCLKSARKGKKHAGSCRRKSKSKKDKTGKRSKRPKGRR